MHRQLQDTFHCLWAVDLSCLPSWSFKCKETSHTNYCIRMSCCVYFEFSSVSYPLPVIPSIYPHVHVLLWLVLDGCNCKTMRCFWRVLLDTKYWCHLHFFGETPLRDSFHWTAPSPTEMQHRPRRNTGVQSVVRIFVLFFLLGGSNSWAPSFGACVLFVSFQCHWKIVLYNYIAFVLIR